MDKFLDGRLDVCSEDQQIASSSLKKEWTTDGVEFEFSISPKFLAASTFQITEFGHVRDEPMGGADCYWFYLRDFTTNGLLRALRPGMTANEVWEKLFHKPYGHYFGGTGYPDHERWWLTWNYEGEFYFQSAPSDGNIPWGERKLIHANLYKN
ncbi:MAG TPA: hypothetical protein VH280_08075 [Verrucomicrobiae bacterium]|nr:hypothetical protein [Verrucomicrobiae bacterium]